MDKIAYIYQVVAQALALEEEGLVSRRTTESNLRYIRQQLEPLVSEPVRKRAEEHAKATVQAIKDRI